MGTRFEIHVWIKKHFYNEDCSGLDHVEYGYGLVWSGDSILKMIFHLIKAKRGFDCVKLEWK